MVFKLIEDEDFSNSVAERMGIIYGNNIINSHNEYVANLKKITKNIHPLDTLLPLLVFTIDVLNKNKKDNVDMDTAIEQYLGILKYFNSNCVKMAKND